VSELKVYKWSVYLGRGGDLEGMFVATKEDVEASYGKTVMIYEGCGKHSNPTVVLAEDQFKVKSEDPAVVGFVRAGGSTGYDPLEYIHHICDVCDMWSNPEEVVVYWCEEHEVTICSGGCEEHKKHVGCTLGEFTG